MDEYNVLLDVLKLSEAADRAARLPDPGMYSVIFQPTEFPEPQSHSPEEDALRALLEGLTPGQQAELQATFWLGRDYSRKGEYPALLAAASRSLDRFVEDFRDTTSMARSLRRGINILQASRPRGFPGGRCGPRMRDVRPFRGAHPTKGRDSAGIGSTDLTPIRERSGRMN